MSPPIHPLASSQGAVFLINSRQAYFRCGPNILADVGQALFRSYGHFFAEFLGDLSLVRLRLLDEITCVGLRYGFHISNLRGFSWKALREDSSVRGQTSRIRTRLPIKGNVPDFPGTHLSRIRPESNNGPPLVSSVTPSKYMEVTEY